MYNLAMYHSYRTIHQDMWNTFHYLILKVAITEGSSRLKTLTMCATMCTNCRPLVHNVHSFKTQSNPHYVNVYKFIVRGSLLLKVICKDLFVTVAHVTVTKCMFLPITMEHTCPILTQHGIFLSIVQQKNCNTEIKSTMCQPSSNINKKKYFFSSS